MRSREFRASAAVRKVSAANEDLGIFIGFCDVRRIDSLPHKRGAVSIPSNLSMEMHDIFRYVKPETDRLIANRDRQKGHVGLHRNITTRRERPGLYSNVAVCEARQG